MEPITPRLMAIVLLVSGLSLLIAHAEPLLDVRVEPRIVSDTGILYVKVVSLPPGYKTVVARLENGNSTDFVTLSPGSIAAIDLGMYRLQPGLYYVAVYDSPGGKLLARIPVLIVHPEIFVIPPRPTVGKPFRILVTMQPVGVGYTIILHVDGYTREIRPGEEVTLTLEGRGSVAACIDVAAVVGGREYMTQRLYCKSFRLNLPPSVSADLSVKGGYVTLTILAEDPDGSIIAVNYNCTAGGSKWSGFSSAGVATIPLMALDEARRLLKEGVKKVECRITAVDDANATTTKYYMFNLTAILFPPERVKTSQASTAPTATKTPTATQLTPSGGAERSPVALPIPPYVILAAISIAVAGVAAAMLFRRRAAKEAEEAKKEAKPTAPEESIVTEIIARLDRLEQRLEELVGRVGELQGEVDELRRRVRRLETGAGEEKHLHRKGR